MKYTTKRKTQIFRYDNEKKIEFHTSLIQTSLRNINVRKKNSSTLQRSFPLGQNRKQKLTENVRY